MVDVSVTISGIIMCCDESICGLNFGRGYTVEKCNLDTLFFKAKITRDKNCCGKKYGHTAQNRVTVFLNCISQKHLAL